MRTPVTELREWIFSIPFLFPNFGMELSIPVPELQNVISAHYFVAILAILKLEQQSTVYLVYFQIDLQTRIGRTGNNVIMR